MNKEQFKNLVKIRAKINRLKAIKAEMEIDPQKRHEIKPVKQDYLKAAGQVLSGMFGDKNNEQDKKPMTNLDPLPETAHTPYVGFAVDYKKDAYWVYLINPSPSVEYTEIDFYTGAHADDLETSRAYKKLDGLKPLSVKLLEQSDLGGLDFVIWFHLDLFTKDGLKIQVWFSLPKYAGFGNSEKEQRQLDCGIYAYKIPLKNREDKSVLEQAELDKGLNKNNL